MDIDEFRVALGEHLKAMQQPSQRRQRPEMAPEDVADELRRLAALLHECPPFLFKPGHLVTWKDPMLKTSRAPAFGHPAIVISWLDKPVRADENPITSGYCMSFDIELGFLDEDGDFQCCLFDSRRMQIWNPWKPTQTPPETRP